jgi:hypothetical protein
MFINTIFVLFAYLFEVFLLGQLSSERPNFGCSMAENSCQEVATVPNPWFWVAVWGNRERSVQWQQQGEGASLCEGESEFTSDFSIGKCRTHFFSLLCIKFNI